MWLVVINGVWFIVCWIGVDIYLVYIVMLEVMVGVGRVVNWNFVEVWFV